MPHSTFGFVDVMVKSLSLYHISSIYLSIYLIDISIDRYRQIDMVFIPMELTELIRPYLSNISVSYFTFCLLITSLILFFFFFTSLILYLLYFSYPPQGHSPSLFECSRVDTKGILQTQFRTPGFSRSVQGSSLILVFLFLSHYQHPKPAVLMQ